LNKSFDLGLIPRPAYTSWVQEQPARLAVLHKRARRARVEWIGTRHRGREIIQDQPLGAALEESPRLLQALDRGFHRLLDQQPHEAVAAVREDDTQPPHQLTPPRLRIEQQAQPLKIHLGDFARWRWCHAHRRAMPTTAWSEAQLPGETFEAAVRDVQSTVPQ
jgi:hypothetical protein